MIANSNSTIAPEVLASFHQRRNAGESLQTLAREAGMTWQRLWVLMVSTQPKEMLPAVAGVSSDIKTVTLTDRTHRQFDEVISLVSEGHNNIMLVGPAGTGKTTLAKHVAKALERDFAFISLSAGVTETHIFGRMLPQADGSWKYIESPFIRIYRNGGVFLFDEVDAADRRAIPLTCTKLTMFADVHNKLLYYCIVAWQDDFTGFVIDYGTFPEQSDRMFSLDGARKTLGRTYPGTGPDAAIQTGLEKLVATYLATDFNRGAGLMRIDRLLVDMGYKPGIVAAIKHKAGGSAMMLYKGLGLRAGSKPMSSYARRPGETIGHYWYIPNVSKTAEFPHVASDVNYWKTFTHTALATTAGDTGSLTIFGQARDHELFAQHIANSETWTETQGHGRTLHEWTLLPSKPDNHWLDCLTGCAVAASMLGCRMAGVKPIDERKPIRMSSLIRRSI